MTAAPADESSKNGWGERRARTLSWHDPAPTTAAGLALAGIDYIQAVIDGAFPTPPMETQLQITFARVEPGRIEITCRPDESHCNGFGSVHGGLLCCLLDAVSGCALHSTLPRGKGVTSVEIKVSYLRTVTDHSGTLTATGTVVKSGSRVGFTEGVVTDEAGRPIATSTSTLLVFDL